MDDILASIRRILDDEPTSENPAATPLPSEPLAIDPGNHPDENELLLDDSMLAHPSMVAPGICTLSDRAADPA